MLNCTSCGLTARPYETHCGACGTFLQEEAAARQRRAEWDALAPKIRDEFESTYDKTRAHVGDYRRWLRKSLKVQAAVSAALLTFVMNVPFLFSIWPSLLLDPLLGALAAAALHKVDGGAYRGLGIFAVAVLISAALRVSVFGSDLGTAAGFLWLFSAVPGLGVICYGYFAGHGLESARSDHSTLP